MNLNTKDGTSLLAVAVGAGQEVVARFLIEEKGATLNVFNRANQTELDACKLSSLSAYLKSKGALTGKSAIDSSFLFASIMSGNISQITMLLEKNEELREQLATLRDKDGNTPLSVAVTAGHAPVVQLLVERFNMEVNVLNNHNQTPLMIARARKNDFVIAYLKKHGAQEEPAAEDQRPSARDVSPQPRLGEKKDNVEVRGTRVIAQTNPQQKAVIVSEVSRELLLGAASVGDVEMLVAELAHCPGVHIDAIRDEDGNTFTGPSNARSQTTHDHLSYEGFER